MAKDEKWLPVVGFEDLYEVSEYGRVRSLPRVVMRNGTKPIHRKARELKVYPNVQTRYMMAHLTPRAGHMFMKKRTVHSLVLEAFVGPRPEGHQACHGDGDRSNNHVSNLRWDTVSSNAYDRVAHGKHPNANKTECLHGHPLDGTYRRSDGGMGRFCRTCGNARNRRRYHELKAAKRAEEAA